MTDNPITATLRAARAQIADPAAWCQQFNAIDVTGHPVGYCDARAVAWSAGAAVWVAVERDPPAHTSTILEILRLLDRVAGMPLLAYNDSHTHADILALFDRAIAASEATP